MLTGSLSFVFLLVPATTAQGAADDTTLVSRGSSGAADGDSYGHVSVSANGRHVAFTSQADNLSDEDDNAVTNVFVRDNLANTTSLISRATGATGAGASDSSFQPSISPDGRYVAFSSGADNLSTEDNDAVANVFVRDTQSSTTTLVSRAGGPAGPAGDGASGAPSISDGGRVVAFQSDADNLVADANPTVMNVYLRDLQVQQTILVSRGDPTIGTPDGLPADGDSSAPSISADGLRIAFQSDADNINAQDNDSVTDIFVRELLTRSTWLESCPSSTFLQRCIPSGDGPSSRPAISAAGGYVAFESEADNLSPDDDDTFQNVYLRDRSATKTTLMSRATGAAGAGAVGNSSGPSIQASADIDTGDELVRFVAFVSEAENLSDQDVATYDIFVRDVPNNTTTLASRASGAGGAAAVGSSFRPSLSGDGLSLGFWSEADNLSSEDNDSVRNVFVRDLTSLGEPPPPPPPPVPPPCHHPPLCDVTGGGSPTNHGAGGHPVTSSGAHTGTGHGAGGHSTTPHGGRSKGQTVAARATQDVDNLLVVVVSHEDATLTLTATVRIPGRSSRLFRFKPVTRRMRAHALKRIRLKLPAGALRSVKRALRRDRRLTARVTVSGRNAAAAVTRARRAVRLKL